VKKKFCFGKNWRSYSKTIDKRSYQRAKCSLNTLIPDIKGKTFLDIGCGSGLFSFAALALGANKVVGIDIDPECVEVSVRNTRRLSAFEAGIDTARVTYLKASILDDGLDLGKFDIVHSWGVLHHTGDMWRALRKACELVRYPDGVLVVAIYNRHITSAPWKWIKKAYIHSPGILKALMTGLLLPAMYFSKMLIYRVNPFSMRRGMNFYHDGVDWIGGYPYEYASIPEVIEFSGSIGFVVVKVIKGPNPVGCNEFILKRAGK